MLYAAIDIGTVSTRLIAARATADGGFAVLDRQAQITDLGEGVDATGALSAAAVGRTVAAVAGYVDRIRDLTAALPPQDADEVGAAPRAVVATTTTSAARDASNACDLLRPLRELGLAPQVITGDIEARLALTGVTADFVGCNVLVADIGGGSTELTCGRRDADGRLHEGRSVSFNVGCRRLTERFLPAVPDASAAPEQIAAARAWARGVLAPFFSAGTDPIDADPAATDPATSGAVLPDRLVCVGGTATSLVAVANRLVPYDSSFVHLHRMGRDEVAGLARRLAGMTARERAGLPGLQPKRAGVIAAGALILDVLLDLGGWAEYTASESDSLMGLLACMRAAAEGAPSPIGWTPAVCRIGAIA